MKNYAVKSRVWIHTTTVREVCGELAYKVRKRVPKKQLCMRKGECATVKTVIRQLDTGCLRCTQAFSLLLNEKS